MNTNCGVGAGRRLINCRVVAQVIHRHLVIAANIQPSEVVESGVFCVPTRLKFAGGSVKIELATADQRPLILSTKLHVGVEAVTHIGGVGDHPVTPLVLNTRGLHKVDTDVALDTVRVDYRRIDLSVISIVIQRRGQRL